MLHIFIRDFASLAHPLVHLTKKGVPFNWGESQQNTMQCLKDAICQSPALHQLDYESSGEVILAIDTSLIAVGYILSQEGDDGKHYPDRFGSIRLSDVKSCYSQAKLELYGLFCALWAVRIFVFGVNNFTVEMDTKYIQGMINNPDLDSLCITPILVTTNSDSHHDVPAIPCTARACAKDDQIDQIHDFLCDHICPPDLSDLDYTSFINVPLTFSF